MSAPAPIIQHGIDWRAARIYLDWDGGQPESHCSCHVIPRPTAAMLHIEGFDPSKTAWDLAVEICEETAESIEEDIR